jgi:hypothetical protein
VLIIAAVGLALLSHGKSTSYGFLFFFQVGTAVAIDVVGAIAKACKD